MLEIIIAVAISVVLTAAATTFVVTGYQKKSADAAIGGAQDKAREIIDEALKTAESKKRESLLEVKE
ncbi:MAG: DUF3552 domain-containing protein, partial [Lachnospiraceae bacterium]|nr:DUF3552 domain-containing protein [Lachnospiraceae bacterium]